MERARTVGKVEIGAVACRGFLISNPDDNRDVHANFNLRLEKKACLHIGELRASRPTEQATVERIKGDDNSALCGVCFGR